MAEPKTYCGRGKEKKFDNGGSVINISLDTSKLPAPNDKGWINLTVAQTRSEDKFGNTHTVYVNEWKPKTDTNEAPF